MANSLVVLFLGTRLLNGLCTIRADKSSSPLRYLVLDVLVLAAVSKHEPNAAIISLMVAQESVHFLGDSLGRFHDNMYCQGLTWFELYMGYISKQFDSRAGSTDITLVETYKHIIRQVWSIEGNKLRLIIIFWGPVYSTWRTGVLWSRHPWPWSTCSLESLGPTPLLPLRPIHSLLAVGLGIWRSTRCPPSRDYGPWRAWWTRNTICVTQSLLFDNLDDLIFSIVSLEV